MKGFSLAEMLITLTLLSLTTLMCFRSFSGFYDFQDAKNFQGQLSAALKLAQSLSLTRNEDLTICAQINEICQTNWQGTLVVLNAKNEILQNFGTTPKNLMIEYSGFYKNNLLLIQNHGLLINNGTFHITTSKRNYDLSISKQGVLKFNETSGI